MTEERQAPAPPPPAQVRPLRQPRRPPRRRRPDMEIPTFIRRQMD